MERINVNGCDIELERTGDERADAVIMLHGSVHADTLAPVQHDPAFSSFYVIRYHRAGHLGSGPRRPATSMSGQAAECWQLMQALGIEKAHILGDSHGAGIALQLALDLPSCIRSLALFEPSLPNRSGALIRGQLAEVRRLYETGEWDAACELLMLVLCGPNARARSQSDSWAKNVARCDAWFESEQPGRVGWDLPADTAERIRQPVLAGRGGLSGSIYPGWTESYERLVGLLPHAERHVFEQAAHPIPLHCPSEVASVAADFFRRHSR